MTRPLHHPTLHRALLLAAMVALVLAQMLGLMHRVLHSPTLHERVAPWVAGQAAAEAHAKSVAAAQAHAALTHSHWLQALFADHDRSGCEGYDQLTHADLLWSVPASQCPRAVTEVAPPPTSALHIAAQAAGYLARGPPQRA